MFFLLNSGDNENMRSQVASGSKSQNNINRTNYAESTLQGAGANATFISQNFGRITKSEFMKIFEVYELWKYESQFSTFFQEPPQYMLNTTSSRAGKKA
jgi:hypothetical protein